MVEFRSGTFGKHHQKYDICKHLLSQVHAYHHHPIHTHTHAPRLGVLSNDNPEYALLHPDTTEIRVDRKCSHRPRQLARHQCVLSVV